MTVRTHAGGLPWSGPTSLNAISVMHDIDLEGSNFVASPTLSTPRSLASGDGARAAGAAGEAAPGDARLTAAAATAGAAAAAATAAAAGGEAGRSRSGAGARSMYLGSDGEFFCLAWFWFVLLDVGLFTRTTNLPGFARGTPTPLLLSTTTVVS